MEVGIFSTVDNAIYSVKMALERYSNLSLEDREEIIAAIRKKLNENVVIRKVFVLSVDRISDARPA